MTASLAGQSTRQSQGTLSPRSPGKARSSSPPVVHQWIKAQFQTFLTTLAVEIFDCLKTNIDIHATKLITENVDFDSGENTISYECWTPVIAGTNVQASSAWLLDTSDVKPAVPTVTASDVPEYKKTVVITPTGGFPAPKDKESMPAIITENTGNGTAVGDLYGNGLGNAPTQTSVPLNVMNGAALAVGDEVVVTKTGANHYVQPSGGISSIIAGGTDTQINTAANTTPTTIGNGVAGALPAVSELPISNAFRVILVGGVPKIALNIRDIRVYDPASGLIGLLSDVIRVTTGNFVTLKHDVKVSDASNGTIAAAGWKYDSTNGKWIMEGTFLQPRRCR